MEAIHSFSIQLHVWALINIIHFYQCSTVVAEGRAVGATLPTLKAEKWSTAEYNELR